MGLYRRGKYYWFSIQYQGERIQESLKTDNKRLADKLYAKVLTDIIEDRYFEVVKAKKVTFAEMVDKYMQKYQKSRDKYTVRLFLPVLGSLTLNQITPEILSDYRDERLMSVKPATVYQELGLIRRMFNVAKREWRWAIDNPATYISFHVGDSNKRDRWLTSEEEERLLKEVTLEWLKRIIVFAIHTGMRRGEIVNLKWQDVDLRRKIIRVEKSKNHMKRGIPMNNSAFELLNKQKVRDISGKVFPVKGQTISIAFIRTVKRAKIENFRFHDLRHTFATILVQKGVDLYKVKKLLGHKTITMTERYAHHYPESLRSSIEMLDKCYNSVTLGAGSV